MRPRSRDMILPEVCQFVPPPRKQRAQGRPGARCTRGLVCIDAQEMRTRAYRFSGGSPAFPAQWFYGLFRALPGDRAFLPPLLAVISANVTPASRRQDHTTSPYASGTLVNVPSASTASRPAFRDDREPPLLVGRDGRNIQVTWRKS